MAYQGEYFIQRYGDNIAGQSPPIRRMLEMGIPVGGGTDATRVSGYNPWITLFWVTTGKTIGGTQLYDNSNRLERMEALRLMTHGSAWFSREQAVKDTIEPGKYADFIFSVNMVELTATASITPTPWFTRRRRPRKIRMSLKK